MVTLAECSRTSVEENSPKAETEKKLKTKQVAELSKLLHRFKPSAGQFWGLSAA